jgi:hypothetical protein
MKTEYEYGHDFAEWIDEQNPYDAAPVDIDEMVKDCFIVEGDLFEMLRSGIEKPDIRLYWEGFNSFFGEV